MPANLAMYTREMNNRFAGRCDRIKVSFKGDFIGFRIEDPGGFVRVLVAHELTKTLGKMLYEDKLVVSANPVHPPIYHNQGVETVWQRVLPSSAED